MKNEKVVVCDVEQASLYGDFEKYMYFGGYLISRGIPEEGQWRGVTIVWIAHNPFGVYGAY